MYASHYILLQQSFDTVASSPVQASYQTKDHCFQYQQEEPHDAQPINAVQEHKN